MKRIDHHRQIIEEARLDLDPARFKIIEFNTAQKMPRPLRGVPDLNLQRFGHNWWIEIKPLYANYMRDQMSDLQWSWFHERFFGNTFGPCNKYAVVTDSQELLDFVFHSDEDVWMPEYHWERYHKWLGER